MLLTEKIEALKQKKKFCKKRTNKQNQIGWYVTSGTFIGYEQNISYTETIPWIYVNTNNFK